MEAYENAYNMRNSIVDRSNDSHGLITKCYMKKTYFYRKYIPWLYKWYLLIELLIFLLITKLFRNWNFLHFNITKISILAYVIFSFYLSAPWKFFTLWFYSCYFSCSSPNNINSRVILILILTICVIFASVIKLACVYGFLELIAWIQENLLIKEHFFCISVNN